MFQCLHRQIQEGHLGMSVCVRKKNGVLRLFTGKYYRVQWWAARGKMESKVKLITTLKTFSTQRKFFMSLCISSIVACFGEQSAVHTFMPIVQQIERCGVSGCTVRSGWTFYCDIRSCMKSIYLGGQSRHLHKATDGHEEMAGLDHPFCLRRSRQAGVMPWRTMKPCSLKDKTSLWHSKRNAFIVTAEVLPPCFIRTPSNKNQSWWIAENLLWVGSVQPHGL